MSSVWTGPKLYSKEPKSVIAFDLFTFFHTDLIQSEASFPRLLIGMSAWKNVC